MLTSCFFRQHMEVRLDAIGKRFGKKCSKSIVPKKFVIEQSVFIIDSKGNVSNEVDLAIFDEMYTPYVFRYGEIKFIPIEAVVAVVECKSTSMDEKLLENWINSIEQLKNFQ